MPTTYAGNPANNPTSITIPSDGDGKIKAADVNPGFEGLMDKLAFLAAHLTSEVVDVTATGTWTAPAGVTSVDLEGYGGGGGGGFGCDGDIATDAWALSGAGGGAALRQRRRVAVTPGTQYDITIGAGGTAGARPATQAGDGGDTIFAVHLGATLATFSGASAGNSVQDSTTDRDASATNQFSAAVAGGPVSGITVTGFTFVIGTEQGIGTGAVDHRYSNAVGVGGIGITNKSTPRIGNRSLEAFAGGAAGTNGTNASTVRGGGGGGGGAGGPGGAGGAGGNGSNAATGGGGGGSSANGGAGTAAAANTGAGGGGGGGAGCTSAATAGHGGNGAAGGSGFLRISYVAVVP